MFFSISPNGKVLLSVWELAAQKLINKQKDNNMNKSKIENGQPTLQQHNVSSRTLKVWNGRGHGKYDRKHINVAAYSKKQAAEIIGIACQTNVSVNEITVYYSACWGNSMKDIIPTEPCVYIEENYGKEKPVRVY